MKLLLERVEEITEGARGKVSEPVTGQGDSGLPAAELGTLDDDAGMDTAERGKTQELLRH